MGIWLGSVIGGGVVALVSSPDGRRRFCLWLVMSKISRRCGFREKLSFNEVRISRSGGFSVTNSDARTHVFEARDWESVEEEGIQI